VEGGHDERKNNTYMKLRIANSNGQNVLGINWYSLFCIYFKIFKIEWALYVFSTFIAYKIKV